MGEVGCKDASFILEAVKTVGFPIVAYLLLFADKWYADKRRWDRILKVLEDGAVTNKEP